MYTYNCYNNNILIYFSNVYINRLFINSLKYYSLFFLIYLKKITVLKNTNVINWSLKTILYYIDYEIIRNKCNIKKKKHYL